MNQKEKILAVVGPTGSGKTRLGVVLAKKFNGVILSADSRQVYQGLNIGTNKEGEPGVWSGYPARYLQGVPQLLVDVERPGTRFTLSDWLKLARESIEEVIKSDKLPIVVGGTGLYVTALTEGWQPFGEDQEFRQVLEGQSLAELQSQAYDLKLNRSDFSNPRRLKRALEKKKVSEEGGKVGLARVYDPLIFQLDAPRERLYQRSDERFERIFDDLEGEVSSLLSAGVDPKWLESLGLDYRYMSLYLGRELSRVEAISQFQRASRNYIRRQLTWWRGHGPVVEVESEVEAVRQVTSWLKD